MGRAAELRSDAILYRTSRCGMLRKAQLLRQCGHSTSHSCHIRESAMQKLIAIVVLGLLASAARGADQPLAWPQFRGPGGSSVADDQKPPVHMGLDKNV